MIGSKYFTKNVNVVTKYYISAVSNICIFEIYFQTLQFAQDGEVGLCPDVKSLCENI